MEQNTQKFRLRLNLFDAIILVLALAVGAFLAWNALKPEVPTEVTPEATVTLRYTVRGQRMTPETVALVEQGDRWIEIGKNSDLGRVVSAEAVPCELLVFNHETGKTQLSVLEGYEDMLVTLEAPCTVSEEHITVDNFNVRVGLTLYVKGEGYMISGPVIAMELEGEA